MTIKQYIEKEGIVNFQKILTTKGQKKVKYPNWIITDTRFENEAQAIKDRDGIIIRVNRFPKTITINGIERVFDKGNQKHLDLYYSGHESETVLDDYKFDYIIDNNSDIPSLIEKIKEILIDKQII